MPTAPRFALRCTFARFDNRDAYCGTTTYTADMVYGTVAGAIVGQRLYETAGHGDARAEIVDLATGAPVGRALVSRALGHNLFSGTGWTNDKDGIPF